MDKGRICNMEYSFSKDKSPVLLHNPPNVFGSGDCVFRFDFIMCIENEQKNRYFVTRYFKLCTNSYNFSLIL